MPIERAWMDRYMAAGFIDTLRKFESGGGHYSWWSNRSGARERNVGWRLDYFLATADLNQHITAATIHADVLGSDHCPVSVDIALKSGRDA
jgi:exodeoxyribonuclease-3